MFRLLPILLIPIALVPSQLRRASGRGGAIAASAVSAAFAAGGKTQGQDDNDKEMGKSAFLHSRYFQKAGLSSG